MPGQTDKLEIEIVVDDKASGPLKGINGVLGTLGGVAGGVLAGGLGLATTGIGALVTQVQAGTASLAEVETINAQTAAAIESTGMAAGFTAEQIAEMSGALATNAGVSDESTQQAANMLLTFTSIGKDVFPDAIQTIADMSRAMDTTGSSTLDMTGTAIQLGKALQDPVKGVSALAKVGVNFSDAQKEQIKTMVEAGDTMGAQKLILAELAKEFGGSAAAFAQTAKGQAANAGEAFETLQQSLAGPFLGAVKQVFAELVPILTSMQPAIAAIGQSLGDALATILPKLLELLPILLNGVVIPLLQLGASVLPPLVSLISAIMAAAAPLITTLVAEFAPMLTLLINTLLPPLTELLPVITTVLGTVATAFIQVFTAIIPLLGPLLELIGTILVPLANLFTGVVQAIMPLVTTILGILVQLITTVIRSMMPLLNAILPPLAQLFVLLVQAIAPLVAAILPVLAPLIQILIQLLVPLVQLLLPVFIQGIQGLAAILQFAIPYIQEFANWIAAHVVPAIEGISNAIQPVIGWIQNLAGSLSDIRLPSWLTPGSPTPLETGLRGIGKAAQALATKGLPDLAVGLRFGNQSGQVPLGAAGSVGAGTGFGGPQIVLQYQPTFSMADQAELRNKLQPMLDQAIRQYNRGAPK